MPQAGIPPCSSGDGLAQESSGPAESRRWRYGEFYFFGAV